MDKELFMGAMIFMAGVVAGYLAHPLIEYAVYYLVYVAGNKVLNWLYEKGWIE